MSNNNEASRPKIEVRSIDYVPRHERHGKVWHQAPFWFTGNFVLTTMVTGFTGPALGLGRCTRSWQSSSASASAPSSWPSMPTRARAWACRR